MTKFQVQVNYKLDPKTNSAETEILSFGEKKAAETFYNSVIKNPDVENVRKLY